MSGKGRGSFLSFKNEDASCSSASTSSGDNAVKDSGLGSRSPIPMKEYTRVGRGKILEELASSCSNLTISSGRGRAQLFTNILEKTEKGGSSDKSSEQLGGRGRALLFKNLMSIETLRETTLEVKQEETITVKGRDRVYEYFKPKDSHGIKGTPLQLACNYIRLDSDPSKGVYVYEVRFSPSVDSINLRMKYLNEHRDFLGGTKTFDGVTLYLPLLLTEKLTTLISKNVTDGKDIEIRILFKHKESLKNCIHLYNVLFDRVMKTLNYVRFDRKQFDPTSPKIIPHAKLEVWPGYVTAVDEYEGGLLLCCDVSHRLLCQKSVLDMLTEIFHSSPQQFQENAKKSLLGSVVITRYNNRTYRIDEICFDKNPLSTFSTKNGDVSYVDYYKKNYNIEIIDKKQPLLISIKKQRSMDGIAEEFLFCLIPEICFLTGLRDDIRSDYKLMREIATFTRVTPNQRLNALQKFYENINNCAEAREILQSWGLSLRQSCDYISGRQMEEEQIYFAKIAFSAGVNAEFSKYATNNELLDVVHLRNWLLIHCKTDTKFATSFCEHMERNTRPFGMQIQKPRIVVLNNDRIDTFVHALRENIQKSTQIVVCICPTSRDDRYGAIKKLCCAEIPIPSQVINARTLSNETKNRSIVQKIALQMNCKMGGSLWAVKIPFKNVMICGIDSYHDPGQKENSVAAFVASLNNSYTNWYSKAIIQSRKEEIVNGLCSAFTAALNAFEKVNGVLPDNVIIYRDGVGDGQLPLCANYEIPQLEAACQKMFTNYSLKVTFIVVQKRINTRIFTVQKDGVENPRPGTVVDDIITRKVLYDFFLVSQSVRQGTVSPTHFIVLRDDANYKPDIIQRLSYKLCFLYYNWPGTIRIPACCQYAHKLAYLIGQSVRRTTSEELANKLFYL